MSPEQREQLNRFALGSVTLSAGDPRWGIVQTWQRKGLVRAVPLTKHVARIELTDAGRAALREGLADG